MFQAVATNNSPAAIGPYSQAIDTGAYVFVSGQLPLDPVSQQIVEGGIQQQTEQVLKNIQSILVASELSLSNVVKTTVFLSSMDDFGSFNEVYGRYFTSPHPARSTVEVSRLPKNALIEVEVISLRRT